MKLAYLEYPGVRKDMPPLVVAHGLFGSARNWRAHSKRMGAGRDAYAVDMRNHGDSPWDDANSYFDMAGDLAEMIEGLGGKASVLGHSMGGKAAMVLALTRPELIDKLIVADISPVAYPHSLAHHIEAMQKVDLTAMRRRGDVEDALEAHIDEKDVRTFLALSADLKADPPKWDLNLDVLLAEMDAITGFPEVSGQFTGPTLFLTGLKSNYVTPDHREKIISLFPAASHVGLKGAGHWLHAEKPREFLDAVTDFLGEG